MYHYLLLRLVFMVHFLANASVASNEIDQEHLKAYPFCGRLRKLRKSSATSSRVTNSRDSDRRYPWVLFIRRTNLRKTLKDFGKFGCTASVITSRYVKMLSNAFYVLIILLHKLGFLISYLFLQGMP